MVLRFKPSNKGNQKIDPSDLSNITIEAKHQSMVQYFKSLQKSLPEKRKQLKQLIKEYKELRNLVLEDKMNIDLMIRKNSLRDEIESLQKTISSIENREEEKNYFMEVGDILNSYFDNIEESKLESNDDEDKNFFVNSTLNDEEDEDDNKSIEDSEEEDEDKEDTVTHESVEEPKIVNIKDLLKDDSPHTFNENIFKEYQKNKNRGTSEAGEKNTHASSKITDFVGQECKVNKKELLDEYLRKVDKNYAPKLKIDNSIFKCENCDVEMLLYASDGVQICEKCGLELHVMIESEKPSFKDPPLEAVFFSYKRINHFNELLAQFQAKESTEIPDDVFNIILGEIKKERISNLSELTTHKIKKYLKKNGLTKYTDHVAHILYRVNGVPPPQLSKDLEDKLRLMFKEIQGPFMEVCPNDRKNLLNYSYVLHKFFELLELDEFKKHFVLLKNREKLYQTEMVWKKICEKLGWKFIRSI